MKYMMNESRIKELFRKLELQTQESNSYRVLSLTPYDHKLGKSSEGYPKFFISVNEQSAYIKNIIREFLSVEYNQICIVEDEEGNKLKDTFAIITLKSHEWALQSYFIDIVFLILQKMQSKPTKKELMLQVETLITIFSALQNPPVKKLQGLWGELLVIEQGKHLETLINAWHNSPNAKFDFTLGRDKIEVKTTSSETRIHQFSLDQLNPSPNSRLLIASITVRESGKGNGGKSIQDLYDSICSKVSGTQERLHLFEVIANSVGKDINRLDSVFFDYVEAIDSLTYYKAQDVPRILKSNVPAGVTEVEFRSNLTDVPSVLNTESYSDYLNSPLFKSIF